MTEEIKNEKAVKEEEHDTKGSAVTEKEDVSSDKEISDKKKKSF